MDGFRSGSCFFLDGIDVVGYYRTIVRKQESYHSSLTPFGIIGTAAQAKRRIVGVPGRTDGSFLSSLGRHPSLYAALTMAMLFLVWQRCFSFASTRERPRRKVSVTPPSCHRGSLVFSCACLLSPCSLLENSSTFVREVNRLFVFYLGG